ncbi:MAG: alpha-glucan family phosphorylase [Methylacidiphilales bacterium]|nr:alpha-glucan family phosphorylase [Candidatus Methylacidiphilales bacterium]MDW8349992.1 alpha-glucan family phosphorylase [Verrucomicrobiae bacterium]
MQKWPFSYSCIPQIPPRIEGLRELAYNLWWTWNPKAIAIFNELDPALWKKVEHNPVRLLHHIPQTRLIQVSEDPAFVSRLDAVLHDLHQYLSRSDRWFPTHHGHDHLIAYFSAEFGFHESLPIYSGGLGILAGDHCKSASDLGVPFIAVGLLYRIGYFKQRFNKDGWQESENIHFNFYELPITEMRHADGTPVTTQVDILGTPVTIKVWQALIGNVRLLLLDTDISENTEEHRKITYQLYGGDHETRIKQEIVLGIGGVRAIAAIGLKPTVYHMNEGHAAFLSLERIRQLITLQGLNFSEALQVVAASNLFTTHTPVPAGNDAFSPALMHKYFDRYAQESSISFEEIMRLGRPWEHHHDEPFSMTILGLRTSRQANGVSAIHGHVSREMWQNVWPGVPVEEIPIGHITNGIHTATWMAPEIRALFDRSLGPNWIENSYDPTLWSRNSEFDDEEFWNIHQALKVRLIHFARNNVRQQRIRTGFKPEDIVQADQILDPSVLTIGFARRFATYKRATLLFRDLDRLNAIVNHPEHPVQFIFAGKAHPADEGGKKLIQRIYQICLMPEFRNRIVLLENYDINLARYLYHGVDVWLNNPTRPLEASGTSGEKVCPNGVLNLSVRDGWWDEAYDGANGWAIGEDVVSHDASVQDEFDAVSLYTLIEQQVAPLYYRRDSDEIPHEWISWCRHSIETICPIYNTGRMVQDYCNQYYLVASRNGKKMAENNYSHARNLSQWKDRVRRAWHQVRAKEVTCHAHQNNQYIMVGDGFTLEAKVYLGDLTPQEVLVEAYAQLTSGAGRAQQHRLEAVQTFPDGWILYRGRVVALETGTYRLNVRVIPYHPDLVQKHELRLICWAE